MMKKWMALLALAVLAGCAKNADGLGAADLRSEAYFRGERVIPLTFAQIQMALFKHEAACGSAPRFAMNPGQTAYATLTDAPAGSDDYRQTIVADLMYYRASDLGSWLTKDEERDWRTRATVYSYYAGAQVDARIEQIFSAIAHPGECSGASPRPDEPSADGQAPADK
ncbi:hypothetical protein RE432_16640 [Pusillimonas sp. SM2304]|uniref:hypothetical protein n=1 Tax=Pusillimonas sp. SM2304 TaxID=3073241 RepID=UPI0028749C1F|nr:hypothetical protein [Pusillimonas sp. SM2304]MDS1142065.1 hypothetical protein [Pusillimonas sp. SM2304]